MPDSRDILELAIAAAHRAGAIQMDMFGKHLNVDAALSDDIKLEADRLCEKAIIDTIRATYPSHAILAEESGQAQGADYIWYIDPIDGTVNYYYGIPYFCTTLACYRVPEQGEITPCNMGTPVAAVTYAPPTGDMFLATPETGLTVNGASGRTQERSALADAYIITAYGSSEEKLRFTREVLLPLAPQVRKVRNLGALAYDLANVAAGKGSAVIQYGLKVWDIAAGKMLVEAGGGVFYTKQHASGIWSIAAGEKTVCDSLFARLQAYD